MDAFTKSSRKRAFTLLELLVSTGIISTLLATLLPAIAKIRSNAQSLQCQSNLKQIATALIAYANDNNGRFPPNLYAPAPGMFWSDRERIGKYLSQTAASTTAAGIFCCPADDNSLRSYAMNIWASSRVDSWISAAESGAGVQWSLTSKGSSSLILATEAWSSTGSNAGGWSAAPVIGFAGSTPARRFGADGGVAPPINEGRWGLVNCELPFQRHRTKGNGVGTAPVGLVNIAYADGHVAGRSDFDLVNGESGLSTLDSIWTPIDNYYNH